MTRRRSDIRMRGSAAFIVLVATLCAVGIACVALQGGGGSASASPGKVALASGSSGTRDVDLRPLGRNREVVTRCVSVDYTGSPRTHLRLYGRAGGPLADYLDLKVERGAQPSRSRRCAGFRPESVVFQGKLGSFPRHYGEGLGEGWAPGESHTYRMTFAVDDAVGDRGAGSEADFTWEAR
jgi:hypothetical protein